SMDLSFFAEDRDARNESSYRPDGIPTSWYLTGEDALTLATEIWELCEPSPNSLFPNVDRHILRITCESAFRGITNIAPSADPARFAEFVKGIVAPMGFEEPVATGWKQFL